MMSLQTLDDLAVENFRTYLRFPTVHPDVDYTACVSWLRSQGEEIGLECFITELVPRNPILVMRWQGSDPTLPSILLNSHTDVVPVDRDLWTHDPFAAVMTPDGNIYARGAQDMKSVGIQQLESVRRLKLEGFVPKRTIYLTFVPDEEVGGGKGMQPFVEGRQPEDGGSFPNEIAFVDMNVGLCLDEGIASPLPNDYYAFYEERSPWWVIFRISGQAGHGSKFIENTAVEKLHRLMAILLAFRESEKAKFDALPRDSLGLGNLVSTNINVIQGGKQINVVPSEIEVQVDFRLPPTLDFAEFDRQLHRWADEAGEGVTVDFLVKDMGTNGKGCLAGWGTGDSCPLPHTDDAWWRTLEEVLRAKGSGLHVGVSGGSNDSRLLRRYHRVYAPANSRRAPIKAINFSPIVDTAILHHDSDEFLNSRVFLRGLEVYTELVKRFSSLGPEGDN